MLFEKMCDFLTGVFGVVDRHLAAGFQSLPSFMNRAIRKMISLFATLNRLHGDGFRGMIDALHGALASPHSIFANVIDFRSRLLAPLCGVMHNDVVAFLHSLKSIFASLCGGLGPMRRGF